MTEPKGLDALELAIESVERPPCDSCEVSPHCKAGRLACAEFWKYVRGKADAHFGVSVFGVNIAALSDVDRFAPSARIYKEIYGDF